MLMDIQDFYTLSYLRITDVNILKILNNLPQDNLLS